MLHYCSAPMWGPHEPMCMDWLEKSLLKYDAIKNHFFKKKKKMKNHLGWMIETMFFKGPKDCFLSDAVNFMGLDTSSSNLE